MGARKKIINATRIVHTIATIQVKKDVNRATKILDWLVDIATAHVPVVGSVNMCHNLYVSGLGSIASIDLLIIIRVNGRRCCSQEEMINHKNLQVTVLRLKGCRV